MHANADSSEAGAGSAGVAPAVDVTRAGAEGGGIYDYLDFDGHMKIPYVLHPYSRQRIYMMGGAGQQRRPAESPMRPTKPAPAPPLPNGPRRVAPPVVCRAVGGAGQSIAYGRGVEAVEVVEQAQFSIETRDSRGYLFNARCNRRPMRNARVRCDVWMAGQCLAAGLG